MASRAFLLVCTQALLIQSTFSQCINRGPSGPAPNRSWSYDSLPYDGSSRGYIDFSTTSGGGLPISSSSPITPTGLTIVSENAFEGNVNVFGELPFLGAVALEGALPTAGLGIIEYGCGNGQTGMVSEGVAPAMGAGYGVSYAPSGRTGYGYDIIM